jgi:hypothetical protein
MYIKIRKKKKFIRKNSVYKKNLFKLKTNYKLSMKNVTTRADIATAVKIY